MPPAEPPPERSVSARSGGRGGDRHADRHALWTLVGYELRMLLRDKRTVFASIVLPVLILPVFFLAGRWAEEGREKRQEAATFTYAVTGAEAAAARDWIAAWQPPADDEPAEDADPDPADPDDADEDAAAEERDAPRRLRLEEVETAAPEAALAAEELDLVVIGRPLVASDLAEDEAAPGGAPGDAVGSLAGRTVVELVYRSDDDASETAAREMERRLATVRAERRVTLLRERGFPVALDRLAALDERDVATAEQKTGATLGRWATFFLLILLMTGGSVAAADTLAGEKERGTLETMLTTAATRGEIVLAKQLVVLTVGVVITLVQVANLLLYMGLDLIELPAGLRVDLSPVTVTLLLLLLLPLAGLISSVLLLASGYAKTYKEFQVYFFPIFLLAGLPALAAMLPGIDLRSAVALAPIANVAVAVREVLTGERDWLFLAIAWTVTTGVALAVGRLTMKVLSTERLVTAGDRDRAEAEGGAELLPRRIWRWFGVMWVLVVLGAANLEALQGLRSQVVFNVVVVMLGGSLLIVRRFRLAPRDAFAWRAPRPAVWPLALLAGGAGFLVTVWLARLSMYVFPVPTRALEQLTESLVPESLPLWQLLFYVALLPAICEELTFRGVLLHGLHRRLRPWVLVLVVGLVFGFFHFQLARILPTAFLGMRLAAIVLLTGSIVPAMLWHFANNAIAILVERTGIPLAELDLRVLFAAVAIEALAWWWLWRIRRPYPGLLPWRRPRPTDAPVR